MPKFDLKIGKVIGYDHLKLGLNCQDAIASQQFELGNRQYTIVVVSDGSSAAEDDPHMVHNEIGAQLTTDFLLRQTKQYLVSAVHAPLIPYFLFDDLLDYYRLLITNQKIQSPQETASFVKYNLLCTVLVLIITPEHGLIVRYGDGLVVIDEEILTFDYNDHPPYLGYFLIPQQLKVNASSLQPYFDIVEFDPNIVHKLAVGSDAFVSNLNLIPHFWNHAHPNQIQRNLNVWSKIDHRLLDDATLAVLERKEEK